MQKIMRYPPQRRERLRTIHMTARLRATLERIPDLPPRIELRHRDRLAVRMIDYRHRRTGTRYRHVEDERGGERWYRIEVVMPPAVELPPGAVDEALGMRR